MNGGSFSPKIGSDQPLSNSGQSASIRLKRNGGANVQKIEVAGQCRTSLMAKTGAPEFNVSVENGACHPSICGWNLSECLLIDDADFPVEDDVGKVVVDDCK